MEILKHLRVLVLSIAFASVITTSNARKNPKTRELVLPVDIGYSNLYYTRLFFKEVGGADLFLLLDLGNSLTWFDCGKYQSPSRRPVPCPSSICTSINPGAACHNASCVARQFNPLTQKLVSGGVNQDTFSFINPYVRGLYTPARFTFLCSPADNLGIKDDNALGILGLSGADDSFPAEVTSSFNIARKFALCLPTDDMESEKEGGGRLYIGGASYSIPPFNNSHPVPLTLTPFATRPSDSHGYFLTLKSISVDGNPISFDPTLLSIDGKGNGGTKLSTLDTYTLLHSDIYKALVKEFEKGAKAMGIRKAPVVAPFSHCYKMITTVDSVTGLKVPPIDFTVPGRIKDERWRFYGANTMVEVSNSVTCLAFIDGGPNPKTSVVIGAHQLQDYLLEFDLTTSVMGFSSSLLLNASSCSRWS